MVIALRNRRLLELEKLESFEALLGEGLNLEQKQFLDELKSELSTGIIDTVQEPRS